MRDYLPSNGSEGQAFESAFCFNCVKYPADPDAKQCPYWIKALCGEFNGKWFIDDAGNPICTAFKSRAEHNREQRERRRKKAAEKPLPLLNLSQQSDRNRGEK